MQGTRFELDCAQSENTQPSRAAENMEVIYNDIIAYALDLCIRNASVDHGHSFHTLAGAPEARGRVPTNRCADLRPPFSAPASPQSPGQCTPQTHMSRPATLSRWVDALLPLSSEFCPAAIEVSTFQYCSFRLLLCCAMLSAGIRTRHAFIVSECRSVDDCAHSIRACDRSRIVLWPAVLFAIPTFVAS
jgi:hypothetical protein